MNDAKFLQILETRLAKLERAARWYRVGFFAVCVLAVGMGAKEAAKETEFDIVKAQKFELITPDGVTVGHFTSGISRETNEIEGTLLITNEKATRATAVMAGKKELVNINK